MMRFHGVTQVQICVGNDLSVANSGRRMISDNCQEANGRPGQRVTVSVEDLVPGLFQGVFLLVRSG